MLQPHSHDAKPALSSEIVFEEHLIEHAFSSNQPLVKIPSVNIPSVNIPTPTINDLKQVRESFEVIVRHADKSKPLPSVGHILRRVNADPLSHELDQRSRFVVSAKSDAVLMKLHRSITAKNREIIRWAKDWCKSDDMQRQIGQYADSQAYQLRKAYLLQQIESIKAALVQLDTFHENSSQLVDSLQQTKDDAYKVLLDLWKERNDLLEQRRQRNFKRSIERRSAKRAQVRTDKAERVTKLELKHSQLKLAERIAKLTGQSVEEALAELNS